MEKLITDYLITNLAPQLSIRFNLNLNEVEQEIRLICDTSKNNPSNEVTTPTQKQQKQHKEETVKELSKLTIPQLKELAIARHIKIPQKIRKNEIIQQIIAGTVSDKNKKTIDLETKKVVTVDDIIDDDIPKPNVIKPESADRNFTGQIFTSKSGQQWTIGNSIGSGGFGIIYDVFLNSSEKKNEYVIKLEKNKPGIGLYFETSVYRKLKTDGALKMIDSGKLTCLTLPLLEKDEEYYYLILPKFETTLSEKIKQGMTLNEKNNAINNILNRLKFINSKGYIHLDIKPDNIMLLKNEWYLIDFGISYNYVNKKILINKKQAGNGTPLYMSRDMHVGLVSRKADLESLIYVLIEMNNIQFPWIRKQEKKEKKETFMNWILEQKDDFMEKYKDLPIPQSHKNFIEKVNALKIKNNPNYDDLKIK
ncbi:MAG: protein kinase domain-containing protein [Cetobacterium sp.]